MAGGGGSPAREGGGGRAEWLRVYDRMVAILRKSHGHVEALLADRARLEALVKVQHQFWVARDGLLQGRLREARRTEARLRRCDEARLGLLLGDKEREVRRYQIYAEHQDDDLEDFRTFAVALAEENTKLKLKLEEVENSAKLREKTTEHEPSGRNRRAEIRELKKAYKNLSSKKDKEVSALLAEKDFVWNQYKTMEKDYDSLLKNKKIEAAQATEAARKLQRKVEELQVTAQKKDDDISRLQTEANGANKKILDLEKDKEASALLAENDFVWNQYKTMEKDYNSLLKNKKKEAAQATEAAQKLQRKVEELQVAAQKKDDDISRLQAEANGANKKILDLENKLQKLHSLDSEEDEETQKLKGGHLQASQKRKKDINGTHRKSRSEGVSLRAKSKINSQRQMVEDQPESGQKRQCASSLPNGVGLRPCSSRMHLKPAASPAPQQGVRLQPCSSRMHLKPAVSPAPQQILFHSSFKVPKLKTPAPPRPL